MLLERSSKSAADERDQGKELTTKLQLELASAATQMARAEADYGAVTSRADGLGRELAARTAEAGMHMFHCRTYLTACCSSPVRIVER